MNDLNKKGGRLLTPLSVGGQQVVQPSGPYDCGYPLRFVAAKLANAIGLIEKVVAVAVLVGTISFDKDKKQLVKTYNAGLDLVAPTVTLDLMDPKTSV